MEPLTTPPADHIQAKPAVTQFERKWAWVVVTLIAMETVGLQLSIGLPQLLLEYTLKETLHFWRAAIDPASNPWQRVSLPGVIVIGLFNVQIICGVLLLGRGCGRQWPPRGEALWWITLAAALAICLPAWGIAIYLTGSMAPSGSPRFWLAAAAVAAGGILEGIAAVTVLRQVYWRYSTDKARGPADS